MTELLDQEWDEIQTTELPPPPKDNDGEYKNVESEYFRIQRKHDERSERISEEFQSNRTAS